MTFYEQALIMTLKIMAFINLLGMFSIIWCLMNIFEPKPKIHHSRPTVGSIIKLNAKGESVWVAPDGTETPIKP